MRKPEPYERAFSAFVDQCRRRALRPFDVRADWDLDFDTWCGEPAMSMPVDGLKSRRLIGLASKRFGWLPSKAAGGDGGPALNGIVAAERMANRRRGRRVILLVNGEWSLFASHQAGLPAVCTSVGESAGLNDKLAAQLSAMASRVGASIWIAYDRDAAGERGAQVAARALTRAGKNRVEVLRLPDWLGEGADVDDLHRKVADSGLYPTLKRATRVPIEVEPSRVVVGREAARAPKVTGTGGMTREDAYIDAALVKACEAVSTAPEGCRNHTLNAEAYAIGGLVGAERLDAERARQGLHAAGLACGLPWSEVRATVNRALHQGAMAPRFAPHAVDGGTRV